MKRFFQSFILILLVIGNHLTTKGQLEAGHYVFPFDQNWELKDFITHAENSSKCYFLGQSHSGSLYVACTDTGFNTIWSKEVTYSSPLFAQKIARTGKHLLILGGQITNQDTLGVILSVDTSDGSLNHAKVLESDFQSELLNLSRVSDQTALISGSIRTLENNAWQLHHLALSTENLDTTYGGSKLLQLPSSIRGGDILSLPNDEKLLTTSFFNTETNSTDIGLIKLDKDGTPSWAYAYGTVAEENQQPNHAVYITQTLSGYALTSTTTSRDGIQNCFLVLINWNGNLTKAIQIAEPINHQHLKPIYHAEGIPTIAIPINRSLGASKRPGVILLDAFGTYITSGRFGDSTQTQSFSSMAYFENQKKLIAVGSNDLLNNTNGWALVSTLNMRTDCYHDQWSPAIKDITTSVSRTNISNQLTVGPSSNLKDINLIISDFSFPHDTIVCEPIYSPPPPPVAIAGPDTVCLEESFELVISGDSSYYWTFASDTDILTTDSTVTLSLSSSRTIIGYGISGDQDTATIYIKENEYCYQPEVYDFFSPNGDGDNETFWIKDIEFFPTNTVIIYDKLGEVVFETNAYHNTTNYWSGEKQTDGEYFYILKVTIGAEEQEYTGRITLQR